MDYAMEIARIGEQARRRSALLIDDIEETKRRSAARSREAIEASVTELQQYWDEHGEELLEQERQTRADAEQVCAAAEEQEWLQSRAREHREAIARSVAARRAADVVTATDEDDDEEAAYYRRKSWLV